MRRHLSTIAFRCCSRKPGASSRTKQNCTCKEWTPSHIKHSFTMESRCTNKANTRQQSCLLTRRSKSSPTIANSSTTCHSATLNVKIIRPLLSTSNESCSCSHHIPTHTTTWPSCITCISSTETQSRFVDKPRNSIDMGTTRIDIGLLQSSKREIWWKLSARSEKASPKTNTAPITGSCGA